MDFLDTSGSMQFPAMRRLSLTTGSAFLIVYALDDEKSYEVVKMCIEEIREVRPDFQVSIASKVTILSFFSSYFQMKVNSLSLFFFGLIFF